MKALKMIWIYGWAYTFIIAGLIGKVLDRIGDTAGLLLDKDWFAGIVVVGNVIVVLRVMGVL